MDTEGDTIRPDELLAQLGWVRALARSVVYDHGMADDVLQQVCLLALEKAPSGSPTGPGPRSWLAVVTRSLARRAARSRLRRLRHEQASARPESLPSTVEVAAQREALTTLVSAVAGLDEPYFSAIVERYFQGRSVADIAARQQITAGAVRQRLSRAKGQLRARLERVLAEDRNGWLAAVLPLAPGASLEKAGAKTVFHHLGGSVVAQKAGASGLVKMAAAILIVAGLGFVTWEGLRDGAVADGAASLVVQAQPAAARQAPVEPQLPPVTTLQMAAPAEASTDVLPAHLVGRVALRDSGAPVAGVHVQAALASGAALTQAVTDEDGRFDFAVSEPGVVTEIAVLPGLETRGVTRTLDLRLEPGAETVVDLEVSRGATVSGRVEDAAGRPVPGAHVRSWNHPYVLYVLEQHPEMPPDREVVADAAGEFRLGGLGPTCVISAEAPGQACLAWLTGELAEGAQADGVTLQLGPVREIRGRVLGPDERPVPDCTIAARPQESDGRNQASVVAGIFRVAPAPVETRSDAEGRFVLAGLADLPCLVSVASGSHVSWSGPHAPGDPELLVRLGAGTTLAGQIVSAAGGPLPGAEVTVCSLANGPWPRHLRSTVSGADGGFELVGLQPDDDALLLVRAAEHALHVESPVSIAEGEVRSVRIVLQPALALAGSVVDGQEQPVVGARVRIEGDRILPLEGGVTVSPVPTWESLFRGASEAVTDELGRFRLGQLYDGTFELSVASPKDGGAAASLQVESGLEDLRIVLDGSRPAGVTLAGTVRDALTGRPVESFRIVPMIPSGMGGMTGDDQTFENPDGAFRITGLKAGTIQPVVHAPGYADLRVPERDYEDGEHRLDLQLLAQRVLHLRVVDEDREPLSVNLSFRDASGELLFVMSAANLGTTKLETDERGEAIATGLPAARVIVNVKKGWFGGGQDYAFDLAHELRGTQTLVYGDDGQATVMVFFFGSAGAVPLDPATAGLKASMESLQKQIAAGALSPISAPIVIRARAADGRIVAEQHIDPQAAPGDGVTPVPGFSGPCNVRLTVPAEPLEFEISAAGYEAARRSWQPNREDDSGDILIFARRES